MKNEHGTMLSLNPMDNLWLNALNIVFGLARIRKLVKVFGSAQRAWQAPATKILGLGFESESIKEALQKRENVDPQGEWQKLEKENVAAVSFWDKNYPPLLKEIASPPLLLYLKGNAELLREKSLAVVGTRTPSSYGRAVAETLVLKLAEAGLVIVSGLAQGIDAIAHMAALKAGGKTVGILGCGLDQVYPKMNEPLAKEMLAKNGLMVSEYPLGTEAFKQNFPARNRIIAGLALGTLVIESKIDGGALITAAHALESNREVLALPGSINQPTSAGANKLIQEGAKMVLCAEDVLAELNIAPIATEQKIKADMEKLSADEKVMVEIIQTEPAHIDKIIQTSKLKPHVVSAALTGLELKGLVKNSGGQIYILA